MQSHLEYRTFHPFKASIPRGENVIVVVRYRRQHFMY